MKIIDEKYLIEKLWIDPLENYNAHGYLPFGYSDTEEQAKELCSNGRIYTKKDCWSLISPMPLYRYKKIKKITMDNII